MAARRAEAVPIDAAVLAALEELAGGAVVVLDRHLRVVRATAGAEALLGGAPRGASAAKLLGADAAERGILQDLTSGRATVATVVRPRAGHAGALRVAAVPVHERGSAVGWALLLDEGSVAGDGPEVFDGMWTTDPAMKRMFRVIERVARTDATVLVRGETGSGKELVAQAVHARSSRSGGPFRALNCAAVPGPLLESELFGHARGAFTGAVRDNPGHFKLAHRGTLFLDEVAELSLDLQAKLLRALETRTVMPVGGREPVPVDVRIVAATHRALRKEVEAGRFRADLMYRLRVIPIFIPPLRAREGDVVLLAERLVEEMNARSPRKIARISSGAKAALVRHDWPGNVRELRNVVEYAFAIGDGPVLVETDLPPELLGPHPGEASDDGTAPSARDARLSPEAQRIVAALERAEGSRARAAQILGLSRVTLWRRMRALKLARGRAAYER